MLDMPSPIRPLAGDPLTVEEIFARVRAMRPLLAETADECRALGHLPPRLFEALRTAGAFRLSVPATFGGPQMPIADQVRLVAEISRSNPSAGWTVMILADTGFLAGVFPPERVPEIWPHLDTPTAGGRGTSRAEQVEGGVRVTGSFPFVSGIHHADRVALRTGLVQGGEPVQVDGQPVGIIAVCDRADVQVLDTWDADGLRGTGSTTIAVEDLFVPDSHIARLRLDREVETTAPLSRYPLLLIVNGIGVVLGTTRGLLDAAAATIAQRRTPDGRPFPGLSHVRINHMHAMGMYQAAVALAEETSRDCDERLFAGQDLPPELLGKVVTMCVISAELCRAAADEALELVGSEHVFRGSALNKLYGDLRVATTHIVHRRDNLDRFSQFYEAVVSESA